MKSSYSGKQGNCIEVLDYNGYISISETDSHLVALGHNDCDVITTRENFKAFIQGVKDGEFDHFVADLWEDTVVIRDLDSSDSDGSASTDSTGTGG